MIKPFEWIWGNFHYLTWTVSRQVSCSCWCFFFVCVFYCDPMKFKKYRKKINIRGSLTSKILKVGSLTSIKSIKLRREFSGFFSFWINHKIHPFLAKMNKRRYVFIPYHTLAHSIIIRQMLLLGLIQGYVREISNLKKTKRKLTFHCSLRLDILIFREFPDCMI